MSQLKLFSATLVKRTFKEVRCSDHPTIKFENYGDGDRVRI